MIENIVTLKSETCAETSLLFGRHGRHRDSIDEVSNNFFYYGSLALWDAV